MDAEEMLPFLPQVIASSPVTFQRPSPLLDEMSNFVSFCCCQAELSIALIFPLFTFTLNSLMLFFTVLDFLPSLSACHLHGSHFYMSAVFMYRWPRKAMVGLYFLSKRTQSLWAKYTFREWSEIKSHTCWTQVCVWVMALYLQIVWSVAFGKSFLSLLIPHLQNRADSTDLTKWGKEWSLWSIVPGTWETLHEREPAALLLYCKAMNVY